MIAPSKIKFEAKKKRDENYEFRIFLKGNADDKELDEQFHRLHKELFAGYDCSQCRNCCKMYSGSIPEEDLARDAEYLGLTKEQLIERNFTESAIISISLKRCTRTGHMKHFQTTMWKTAFRWL